jgi:hypothetical protein
MQIGKNDMPGVIALGICLVFLLIILIASL